MKESRELREDLRGLKIDEDKYKISKDDEEEFSDVLYEPKKKDEFDMKFEDDDDFFKSEEKSTPKSDASDDDDWDLDFED